MNGLLSSSAADIVSGAYPMLIRPSSICLSVCLSINLFSNQIGSLSFHQIFPIFGVDVHNNIAPKVVFVEFLFFFACNFLMDL